ncbi:MULTISPECIES: SgcJ/EcaC family oxidoreductase [unclassified Microbacterium]|uniref:SgcJ/EcaC family oxidoreductase n=1 Tax=unclassified Microbacterium TaxID=2609290 RepID=UPI0012F9BE8D|nr:SgcJ/EcaC family oxidoreductase [Microbacterium sp. MAH-37]MVQ40923.1 SgcJ/EcaC family oxidoreductase [Microbacterium sp. MAH-37]
MDDYPAGIDETLDRMRSAWDAGDAAAYAEEFTEDASYVIFAGLISTGRDEIRADHVPVFERWQRGSRMSMTVLDVRMLGADTAVVVTEGGIGKGRGGRRAGGIRHDKVQTYVLVHEGDRWRCAAFQNTKRNRLFAAVNAREKQRLAAA